MNVNCQENDKAKHQSKVYLIERIFPLSNCRKTDLNIL